MEILRIVALITLTVLIPIAPTEYNKDPVKYMMFFVIGFGTTLVFAYADMCSKIPWLFVNLN